MWGRPPTGVRGVVTSVGTGELCIFLNQNSYTCKTALPGLVLPEAYFVEAIQAPPHIQMGWQVKKERRRGWGGVEMSWLMGQWHTVAAGFMSQSKSEYWECSHRVTLAILRIIWQCIMLEICHAKKMSVPSPAAEITTCGEVRTSSPPHFVNSLWTALTRGPIDRGPPHLLRVSDCQNKW